MRIWPTYIKHPMWPWYYTLIHFHPGTMGFTVRIRSVGQKYGPTCHQRDGADVTEFVTLVRLSSLGQHVGVLVLAGYKRRKSALAAGPMGSARVIPYITSKVFHSCLSLSWMALMELVTYHLPITMQSAFQTLLSEKPADSVKIHHELGPGAYMSYYSQYGIKNADNICLLPAAVCQRKNQALLHRHPRIPLHLFTCQ